MLWWLRLIPCNLRYLFKSQSCPYPGKGEFCKVCSKEDIKVTSYGFKQWEVDGKIVDELDIMDIDYLKVKYPNSKIKEK